MTGWDVTWERITAPQIPEHQSTLCKESEPECDTFTLTKENLPLKGTKNVTQSWEIHLDGILSQEEAWELSSTSIPFQRESPQLHDLLLQRGPTTAGFSERAPFIPWLGWAVLIAISQHRQEATEGTRTLGHQIALEHRPDLYQVFMQTPAFPTSFAQAVRVSALLHLSIPLSWSSCNVRT